MYHIGICDDDVAFGCQIEEYLKEYAQEEHIEMKTDVFLSGEECLDFMMHSTTFDLLFLDIGLGKMIDGIQVGHMLRSAVTDKLVQIVYISGEKGYAMQLFRTMPMDFLIKPVKKDEIVYIMEKYRMYFAEEKRFFLYHVGKTAKSIAVSEILYFQCSGKKIKIVTHESEDEFYGKMSDVSEQVDESSFWCIHKSYIINIDHVSEFRRNEIVMVNKQAFPVSRAYRKAVQNKLLDRSRLKRT